MKQEIIKVNVYGIYEWGPGFVTPFASKYWHETFDDFEGIHFRKVIDSMGSIFLVGIYCGGMIHPMDGAKFYVNPDHCGDMKSECEELFKVFSSAACPSGGSVVVHHYYLKDDGTIETIHQICS